MNATVKLDLFLCSLPYLQETFFGSFLSTTYPSTFSVVKIFMLDLLMYTICFDVLPVLYTHFNLFVYPDNKFGFPLFVTHEL